MRDIPRSYTLSPRGERRGEDEIVQELMPVLVAAGDSWQMAALVALALVPLGEDPQPPEVTAALDRLGFERRV